MSVLIDKYHMFIENDKHILPVAYKIGKIFLFLLFNRKIILIAI